LFLEIEMDLRRYVLFGLLITIVVAVLTGCLSTSPARHVENSIKSKDAVAGSTSSLPQRTVLSLDGVWQVAQGDMNRPPAQFNRTVAVPGVLDMAQPAFEQVGVVSEFRKAFWYRKTFSLPGPVPATAILKIHKAQFGKQVYLNGHLVGEHLPCFTPGYFDLAQYLKGDGAENELVIRIGANPQSLPDNIPWGHDFEKQKYLPGIYDSVELILSGTPHIVRIQAAPDLTTGRVRVQTVFQNDTDTERSVTPAYTITEKSSGKIAAAITGETFVIASGQQKTIETFIDIPNYRRWSPEDPFLYHLAVRSETDETTVAFGMRSFSFDRQNGFALLNGQRRYLKGSNTCFFRFMEDPQRGSLPWDEQWVRQLYRQIKSLGWDTLRYSIGFPPEFWYRIADEEGILIQDEYPFWYFDQCPKTLTADQLALEFADWMNERVNHPCVVIWDACNESTSPITAPAIAQVRHIDLSNRPWENSTNGPPQPGDCWESHPYVFDNPNFRISGLAAKSRFPESPHNARNYTEPASIIINEYPWLWLDRQGNPCKLTKQVYLNLLGENSTAEQRRKLYASYLAILTEYWRSYRQAAAVMHFCALSYCRPDGFTSDNFIDVEKLVFEPEFEKAAIRSFAPIGVMIENWDEQIALSQTAHSRSIPVIVINDLENDWEGTLCLNLMEGDRAIGKQKKDCKVKGFGHERFIFHVDTPTKPGNYKLLADLVPSKACHAIRTGVSIRDFEIFCR
jgi:beta-galactosidase/beta-glucuronidase